MAYIKQITVGGTTYDIKDASAWTQIGLIWNQLAGSLVLVKVTTLPTASADTLGKIYLVPDNTHDPSVNDIYDEYITIDNGASANPRYTWEKIGNTDVNLSGYSVIGHTHGFSVSISSSGEHTHSIGAATKKYIDTQANVPLTFKTKSFVTGVTTSNKLVKTTASKATAGSAVSVATVGTAVVYGTADVSAAVSVGTSLGGTKTFNTDAIKSATLGGCKTFNINAIKSATLTGCKTFTTNGIKSATLSGTTTFATAGVTASYASEVLTLSAAGTGTVSISTTAADTSTVGISTTDADTSTVSISTAAASTATVTLNTTSINPAKSAPSTQTITPALANGSITPYTFSDVSVATGDVSTGGTGAAVATGASGTASAYYDVNTSATLLKNAFMSSGSSSVQVVTAIPDSISSSGAHTHSYTGTTSGSTT